ncbi:NnrU family protein, partial [Methylorubrum suomiense]
RAAQVAAQHGGQAAPAGWRNDAIAVVVGLVAWFVFGKYLHPLLIGVAAWPGQA